MQPAPRWTKHFSTGVERVLFSQDGKRLAVLVQTAKELIKVGDPIKAELHWYDGATLHEILAVADLPNDVRAIALDNKGQRLAVATATEVRIYGAKGP